MVMEKGRRRDGEKKEGEEKGEEEEEVLILPALELTISWREGHGS